MTHRPSHFTKFTCTVRCCRLRLTVRLLHKICSTYICIVYSSDWIDSSSPCMTFTYECVIQIIYGEHIWIIIIFFFHIRTKRKREAAAVVQERRQRSQSTTQHTNTVAASNWVFFYGIDFETRQHCRAACVCSAVYVSLYLCGVKSK